MTNACANCKYARSRGGHTTDRLKECRRYPPSAIVMPDGKGKRELVYVWPTVPSNYDCGEFAEKQSDRHD